MRIREKLRANISPEGLRKEGLSIPKINVVAFLPTIRLRASFRRNVVSFEREGYRFTQKRIKLKNGTFLWYLLPEERGKLKGLDVVYASLVGSHSAEMKAWFDEEFQEGES